MVHKVCELVKDVTKYTDDLHKKHKNVRAKFTNLSIINKQLLF